MWGGDGDDFLYVELNDGNDDLDGGLNGIDLPIGDGTDTVVYKYYKGNSTVQLLDASELFSRNAADFGLKIKGALDKDGAAGAVGDDRKEINSGFGNDVLTSIERAAVEAGDGADTLIIDESSQGDKILYIDLGSQSAGKSDTIDLTALTLGATADLAKQRVKWESPGYLYGSYEYDVDVRNAERVLGGTGDDILLAGSLGMILPDRLTGNDKIFSSRLDEGKALMGESGFAAEQDRGMTIQQSGGWRRD